MGALPLGGVTVLPAEPLVVRGLHVRYGRVGAVTDVDLDVPAGAVVGLVGPNGCGKTSTLRAVLGLVRPDAGRLLASGLACGSIAARSRIAYAPDEPVGLDELTVREFGDLVAALWRADREFAQRLVVLLDVFSLAERTATPLAALSHGQRRLASIAIAVALRRPLLLVDEATAALDPEAVVALREVVRAAAAHGSGVLVATHDLHFAETICDRVVLLARGRVAASGTLDGVCARFGVSTLEQAFLAAVGTPGRLEEVRAALGAL